MRCLKFVEEVLLKLPDADKAINLNYMSVQTAYASGANSPPVSAEEKQADLITKNYAKDLLEREVEFRFAVDEACDMVT